MGTIGTSPYEKVRQRLKECLPDLTPEAIRRITTEICAIEFEVVVQQRPKVATHATLGRLVRHAGETGLMS